MPIPRLRAAVVLCGAVCVSAVACHGSAGSTAAEQDDAGALAADGAVPSPDAALADGGSVIDTGATGDAAVPTLAACPTTGRGAIVPAGPCYTLTPTQVGASSAGVNAGTLEYALEPAAAAKGALVVQLNGSGGTPAGQVADPTKNVYNAFAATGYHVIGLAYRSDKAIGQVCANDDACFEATRRTLVAGTPVQGAAAEVSNMRADEAIVSRLEAMLRGLAAAKPAAGWDAYLAGGTVAWDRVVASGHSQGGGHAAMLGKLFALRGVVQLSSTCDAVKGVPASWTNAAGTWATSPHDKFVGLAAPTTFAAGGAPNGGDTTCGFHAAVWTNLGMVAANMHDDAAVCGNTGDTHGASIGCVDNYPRWGALLP